MRQRVLITGASGFIGYHIIIAALQAELQVFAAIRKSSKVDHLKDLPITYTFLNFEDISALTADIQKNQYDYIIHAAGVTSALSGEDYFKYNTLYTSNLAKAAEGLVKKFVFVSSLAAVGPLNNTNGEIAEDTQPRPVTAYGKSKLAAEKVLTDLKCLNCVILRPTAVYGPRETGIYIMFKQLTRGIELYIGKKDQRLSFIYCKDLATVIINALQKGSGAYDLSDGNAYSRYELANITKDILNLRTVKVRLPLLIVRLIAFVAQQAARLRKTPALLNGDKLKELTAANWYCSIDKAKKDLDFAPQYDLRLGLSETLSWYKKENWLK